MENMAAEMKRLKGYFPFRIVWGAIATTGEYVVGASRTKRQVNYYIRKGWAGYVI